MERIVTAVYATHREAEAAKSALKSANVHPNNVRIIDAQNEKASGRYNDGRYDRLSGTSVPDSELHTYHDALDRGETLVQARVRDAEVAEAVRILEGGNHADTQYGGINLSEREKSYTDEHRFGTQKAYGRGERNDNGEVVNVVEERLNVGKREVDKGSVKVRSYVAEREVAEDVTLRDEDVRVWSEKSGRTLSAEEADNLFDGKTIEVHAKGEEAVVQKDAVLKEQLHVDKIADTKDKHVVDTIRETKVDVDDTTATTGRTDRDGQTLNR